jgi:SAM-dependent methyltransferase
MENAITRTPHLDSRLERARTHFANPSPYLTGNYNISLRARIVKQLLGEISNYRILDLGCGDGTISLQFLAANNHITLVDSSDGMLQRAKRNTPSESVTHVDYMCWDIFEFDPDARFDVVFCIGVLAHISSTEGAIAKVAGHLKPGGRCIFQITDDSQLIHKINRWFYSVGNTIREFFGRSPLKLNRMSLADVVDIASQHGLKLTAKQRHRLMLFPGMSELLGRWVIPYDLFVQNRPSLSRHSEDVILLFEKIDAQ